MYYFFFQDRQGCKFITASVVLSIRLCMNICAGKIDEFVLCRTSPLLDQFKTGRGMKTILFLMTIAFFNLRPSDLIEINQFLGIISLVFLHQIQIQPSFNIFFHCKSRDISQTSISCSWRENDSRHSKKIVP